MTIVNAIFSLARAWEKITDITLLRSWYNILPEFVAVPQYEENDFQEIEVLCKDLKKLSCFEHVGEESVEEWMLIDSNDPGYEFKSDTAIIVETICNTDDESVVIVATSMRRAREPLHSLSIVPNRINQELPNSQKPKILY